jgi:hypothetical protein
MMGRLRGSVHESYLGRCHYRKLGSDGGWMDERPWCSCMWY